MARSFVAAVLAVLLAVYAGLAEDKKAEVKKPLGAWTRELAGNTVTFTFEADALKCVITNSGGETITVLAAYGVAEGDTVFGLITKVEKTGTNSGPEKGELFSFRFKADKDALTLSELKGSSEREEAKQLIQGEYKKKDK